MMSHRMVMTASACLFFAAICHADDQAALTELENAGATIKRDGSNKTDPVVKVTCNLLQLTAEANKALKEIENLPAVEFLGAGNTELSITTLRALQGKKTLKRFSITFAKITDDAAKILGTLKSLEALELLAQTDLSLGGLAQVFNLTNLKELTLSDRLVSDDVLAELGRLPSLKVLSIRSVFVTDAGIRSLKRLKNLRTLRIFAGKNITGNGLLELASLNLPDLDLTYSDVTNEKLRILSRFPGLKALRLANASKVTDDAIPLIVELTELKDLDLADAPITKSGIQKLKKSLPKCTIVYENRKRD